MNEMREAAFSARSLYLLCVRSKTMAMSLMRSAEERGDRAQAERLDTEVVELAGEAQRWYQRWERAGGFKLAPIKAHLPMRRVTLDSPGTFDLSNVIRFPTERVRYA